MPRRVKQSKTKSIGGASPARPRMWPVAAALALVTVAVYARTLACDFVWYDDNEYITANPRVLEGLTVDNVRWAFTTFAVANWHPLAWLSHLIDVEIWDTWAAGHHLTNVVLHATNAMLVFILFRAMTGAMWRSALVAALFALHPLHVESVAWVSERKDMLCTFFGLLAMIWYVHYVRQPALSRYALVACAFALSLMSKPMLVTLPFVLLLLDSWPLRRLTNGNAIAWRVVIEKVPLLIMSAASSIVTVQAQESSGAIYSLVRIPFEERSLNAVMAYALYLKMMIWPGGLAVLYPRPGQWPPLLVFGAAAALIGISVVSLRLRTSHPHLLVGWLWYLGTLVPVIGLVQVGVQLLADRYTYVPLVGIFLMLAWSIPRLSEKPRAARASVVGTIALILTMLAMMTWNQIKYWRNSETLFRRALAVTQRNFVAHYNLGYVLRAQHRNQEAAEHFQACLQIEELYAPAHEHLADALAATGQFEEAIIHYQRAIELNLEVRNLAQTYNNLGSALAKLGRLDQAINAYERSIERNPSKAQVHFNLGEALLHARKYQEAATSYRNALRLDDRMTDAHVGLGRALAVLGQIQAALDQFDQALGMDPNHQDALLYKQRVMEGARRLREPQ
jgi:tetratricopeptide (TPR) repeat protein